MPMLTNAKNEPTGAIYGVLNMLRKLDNDYPNATVVCVFDGKGPTFRHEQYAEYKANRPPSPPEMHQQVEPLQESIRAMGWPVIISEGVEADDIIGTLAYQLKKQSIDCLISTGDKDMAQLVQPGICLINTMTGEMLDDAGVEKKFGVRPDQMTDYLSLIGDSSDNIPGVEKVGPKTAVKWLTEYNTLDNIVNHADDISGVVGKNLQKAKDWLPEAKSLVTIKTDVEPVPTLDQLQRKPVDWDFIRQQFERFEFKSWLKDIPSDTQQGYIAVHSDQEKAQYEVVDTIEKLDHWIEKLKAAPIAAIDTETTGLESMKDTLVGISWAVNDKVAAYLPLRHHNVGPDKQIDFQNAVDKLTPWLSGHQYKKVGQNIKYDMHIFENHGIKLAGVAEDTMIAAYLLHSHLPCGMDALALRYLNRQTIPFEAVCGKGAKQISFADADFDLACTYAAEDAEITYKLFQHITPVLHTAPKIDSLYHELEIPCALVLQKMERQGVLIDVFDLNEQSQQMAAQLADLEKQAYDMAGQPFNMNSTKQLREIFFDKLAIKPIKKTPGGVPSVDESVLEILAEDYPLANLLMEYRTLTKLKSTYVDKLPQMIHPKTGRIHTTYSQTTAVTGRLASSDPNLQNIPIRTPQGRKIREAFIAPKDHKIVSADYSQIELRIMAHLSQDPGLLSAFEKGLDIHQATAAEIFGLSLDTVSSEQRHFAKAINFGLIYGMSAFGLSKQIGVDRASANDYINRYFSRYPNVADYMEKMRTLAKEQGYVETLFGRRVWAPDIKSSKATVRQAAERAAINAPMQGTAADLIRRAMLAVDKWLLAEKLDTKMIMQVHDELVFEVPDHEIDTVSEKLPELMGAVAKLSVPLIVGIGVGDNWDQAH